MESSPLTIVLLPFKAQPTSKTVDSVYVVAGTEPTQTFSLIQHQMSVKESSTIYSATRLLLTKVVNTSRYPELIFEERFQDYDCREKTYQSFLVNMGVAHIAEHEGKLVFFYRMDDSVSIQEDKLKELSFSEFQSMLPNLAQDLSDTLDSEITDKWPRFAIFNCEPSEKWTGHYEALYKGLYQNPKEIWRSYKLPKSDFPTEEELKQLKGVVISGSALGAYERVEWFPQIEENIRTLVNKQPGCKVLGVCFGHQIVAQALGGKVTKMKFDGFPMCLNREAVQLKESENPFTNEALGKICENGEFYGIEIHGDHVEEVPPGGRVIGTSKATRVEMFEVGKSVICTQFHPEFNAYIMEKNLLRDEVETFKSYPDIEKVIEGIANQMNQTRCDNGKLNTFFKTFLKS